MAGQKSNILEIGKRTIVRKCTKNNCLKIGKRTINKKWEKEQWFGNGPKKTKL